MTTWARVWKCYIWTLPEFFTVCSRTVIPSIALPWGLRVLQGMLGRGFVAKCCEGAKSETQADTCVSFHGVRIRGVTIDS